jgi:hypothetical protein
LEEDYHRASCQSGLQQEGPECQFLFMEDLDTVINVGFKELDDLVFLRIGFGFFSTRIKVQTGFFGRFGSS